MKGLIYYRGINYIVDLQTKLGYFEYALNLRDTVKTEQDVEDLIRGARMDETVGVHDFKYAYRFEEGKWHFYEYAFDIWECASDYKNHGEDKTDEMLKMLEAEGKFRVDVDGVKHY
jgi:hypothetical protein